MVYRDFLTGCLGNNYKRRQKRVNFVKKNKKHQIILLTLCENNDNNNNNFFRLQKLKVDMLSINQIDFNNSEKTKKKNIYTVYI